MVRPHLGYVLLFNPHDRWSCSREELGRPPKYFVSIQQMNRDASYELPLMRTSCHVINSINHVTKPQVRDKDSAKELLKDCV